MAQKKHARILQMKIPCAEANLDWSFAKRVNGL